MNRRHFVGQVLLGSAVFTSHYRTADLAAAHAGGLTIKFVGMMGFVRRSDNSILVALPGHHTQAHYAHVPFLMARSGSAIAGALGLTRMPGVAAGAFDTELTSAPTDAFVYRCLDGLDLEVIPNSGGAAVDNQATQLAQMHLIAPGKRVRNNLRRWSSATVSLQGGHLANASAHPDAGKVFSFGSYQQPLTDAARYDVAGATLRVTSGTEVQTFSAGDGAAAELWVVSAAAAPSAASDPKRLEHGGILFEYLSDATPITAYSPDAEGRITMATELPCAPGALASLGAGAARAYPPMVELCFNGYYGGDE